MKKVAVVPSFIAQGEVLDLLRVAVQNILDRGCLSHSKHEGGKGLGNHLTHGWSRMLKGGRHRLKGVHNVATHRAIFERQSSNPSISAYWLRD